MSFKLSSKTNSSPLGLYHHNPAPAPRKNSTLAFCQLKHSREGKDHGSLRLRIARTALEGLFGLASTILNKGMLENASEYYDTNNAETEQHDNELTTQMEPVFEFGLSPRPLDRVLRVLVKRPKVKKDDEILVLDGIESLDQQDVASFDVYVSKPFGNLVGSDYGEFVGNELDLGSNGSLELCITHVVQTIGVEGSENIVVTLVPRAGKVNIGGLRIVPKEVFGNLQIQNSFTYRKDETKKLVMINLKNEFQISKSIVRDVSLVLWIMSYLVLLVLFKDTWEDLTKMIL